MDPACLVGKRLREKVEEHKRCSDGRWQKRALGGNYLIPERTCRGRKVLCGRVFWFLVVVGYADLYGVCVGDGV